MPEKSNALVFSTDRSHEAVKEIIPSKVILRLRLEKKGRKGKAVTVVDGLPPHPDFWQKLLKKLKARCGSGGTLKDGVMELQGDQREPARAFLEDQGFTVRGGGA